MSLGHIERLEELLQSSTADQREIQLAIARMSAALKSHFHNGSPASRENFHSAVRLIGRMRGSAFLTYRLECLDHAVKYFYSNALQVEALKAANLMLALSRSYCDEPAIRRAENYCGIVNADLGNVPGALMHYCRAIALAEKHGQVEAMRTTLNNLGTALMYAGLYADAIRCFQKVETFPYVGSEEELSPAGPVCNMAQSYYYLGKFAEGYEAACRAIALCTEPSDAHSATSRAVREFTFVLLALEIGRFSEAKEHSLACRRYAVLSCTSRASFHADLCEGLCCIHFGDVSHGLLILERSLVKAEKGTFYCDALSILTKAYDRIGRPREALECLRRLLKNVQSTRESAVSTLLASSRFADVKLGATASDLGAFQLMEADLRARVAEQELFNSQIELLERLAVTADLKEDISGQHGYRVGKLATLLAQRLNWRRDDAFDLEIAARLHDIGKIGLPDHILMASETLKDAQRALMRQHTTIGAEILARSGIPQLRLAEDIARYHHEWWNGQGYPAKLSGRRIPVSAQIVALADVFDALTHGRPYSAAWNLDRTTAEIASRRGSQFDPVLADAFLGLVHELHMRYSDVDEFLSRDAVNSPFVQARDRIRRMLSSEPPMHPKRDEAGAIH